MTSTLLVFGTATVNIPSLTMPIESGIVYQIKAFIPWMLDTSSGGITIGIDFPAARRVYFQAASVTSNFNAISIQNPIVAPGTIVQVTSGSANTPRAVILDGTILCSGSGDIIFNAKSESNTSAGLLTSWILDGGSIVAWALGPLAT